MLSYARHVSLVAVIVGLFSGATTTTTAALGLNASGFAPEGGGGIISAAGAEAAGAEAAGGGLGIVPRQPAEGARRIRGGECKVGSCDVQGV